MSFETKMEAEDQETYVPDFRDNRERAEEGRDHFAVELLPMTGRDMDKQRQQSFKKKPSLQQATAMVRRIIGERVVSVSGLVFVDRDGTRHEPANGVELWKVILDSSPAHSEIIDDIYSAIQDISHLEEGTRGNLSRRCAGSAQTMRPAIGVASDAGETTTKRETRSLINGSYSGRPSARPATAMEKLTQATTSNGTQD